MPRTRLFIISLFFYKKHLTLPLCFHSFLFHKYVYTKLFFLSVKWILLAIPHYFNIHTCTLYIIHLWCYMLDIFLRSDYDKWAPKVGFWIESSAFYHSFEPSFSRKKNFAHFFLFKDGWCFDSRHRFLLCILKKKGWGLWSSFCNFQFRRF